MLLLVQDTHHNAINPSLSTGEMQVRFDCAIICFATAQRHFEVHHAHKSPDFKMSPVFVYGRFVFLNMAVDAQVLRIPSGLVSLPPLDSYVVYCGAFF
jgi:hypothetical protein